MRREYVDFKENIDINFSLVQIDKYPLVWQNAIRIFFVLKGSIRIGIENEEFTISEDSIEIINKDEAYYISSEDGDNLVLVLDIRPGFFSDYNDQVEDIYYYTNTLDTSRQAGYKYIKLREYITILFYEFINREDGYEERIEKNLLATMYHLLNNFHYLIYEEESLREDEIQLERFTRIISYLKKNYKEGVSLKEIASREFLTPQYLSYKIKDTFGQNFNDFLNKIRVEESRKLLLEGNESISEIALEVGFSHSRYYNKHFKKIHKYSPMEYRKKYQKSSSELERSKKITYFEIGLGQKYLEKYLLNYEGYKHKKVIIKQNIDLEEEPIISLKYPRLIYMGNENILEFKNLQYLRELMKIGNFKYIAMENFREYNFYQQEEISKTVKSLGLEIYRGKLKSKFFQEDLYERLLENKPLVVAFRDGFQEDLYRGAGIFTYDYFKKPAYFKLELICKLSSEIVFKGKNTLVTRSEPGYELLVFNNSRDEIKKFSLNIKGLRKNYSLMIYKLDRELDIDRILKKFGNYKFLRENFWEVERHLFLRTDYGKVEKTNIYNFTYELGPGESLVLKFIGQ